MPLFSRASLTAVSRWTSSSWALCFSPLTSFPAFSPEAEREREREISESSQTNPSETERRAVVPSACRSEAASLWSSQVWVQSLRTRFSTRRSTRSLRLHTPSSSQKHTHAADTHAVLKFSRPNEYAWSAARDTLTQHKIRSQYHTYRNMW